MPPPSRFLPRGAIKRLAGPCPFSTVQSLPARTTGFHPFSLSTTKPPQTQSFHLCATKFKPRINATPLRRNGINPILQWRKPRSLNSSSSSSSSSTSSSSEKLGFSQRMKKLSREYGWSSLGVYLALSVLDFPFCFAAVRLLGVERIGHYEHVIAEVVKGVFAPIWRAVAKPDASGGSDSEAADGGGWGDMTIAMGGAGGTGEWDGHARAAEAEGQNAGTGTGTGTEAGASLWTQLALAYAVHKSLIFIRVPITAAVTPKVVKVLRRWGWDIGKRRPKSS
ncbi:hypothetical protein PABG_07215 [Paracoccidioides brasiliensis Pb03]|nr:hypothetical protein PABG_07215 [Paracoccidioides brasiliensis Pb03]